MAYKYLISGSSVYLENSGSIILNEFQQTLNAYFDEAPDLYTVQEETANGSDTYADATVRIVRAINVYTGEKLGDDFKKIIFKETSHCPELGRKYYFDDNYWIVYNVEDYKNFASSLVVRRANNVLRWVDDNGVYRQEPCIIDYPIKRSVDYSEQVNPVAPAGFIEIFTQLNEKTRKIRAGQRFLFGNVDNWIAYKVYGNGVRNFLNEKTMDNMSAGLLALDAGANFVNDDTDDLTLGIADKYKMVYEIALTPETFNGSIGETLQLNSIVYLNGTPITKNVTYTTSASAIAEVTSGGLVTCIASGSVIMTSALDDNEDITDTCIITVGAFTPVYEIRVSPNDGFVLEGETKTISVYGYINGVLQGDSFVFALANNNVPASKYTLTVLGNNSFSVKNNEMYLDYPLVINATSGSNVVEISNELRGAW